MKLRSAAVTMVVLAATTVWSQSTQPSTSAVGTPVPLRGTRSFGSRGAMPRMAAAGSSGAQTVTPHQRVQDMEGTLVGMHTLLKQMRAKAANSPKDPLIKENLEMWELLVGHLDKQLLDLRVAVAAHDELEARRASLYKQADDKAAAAAQAARTTSAAQVQAAANAQSGTAPNIPAPSPAAPAPAAQSIPTQPASSTSSPN